MARAANGSTQPKSASEEGRPRETAARTGGAPAETPAKPVARFDRRKQERRSLQTRVALKTDRAIFFMESKDISTQGICVESEVGLEVGTRCRLIPSLASSGWMAS